MNTMHNENNVPNEELFIACFLNGTNWKCNLSQMNMYDSEKWLKNNKKKNQYTTIIPFNCKYSPKYFTKLYVNYKLNKMCKTEFTD